MFWKLTESRYFVTYLRNDPLYLHVSNTQHHYIKFAVTLYSASWSQMWPNDDNTRVSSWNIKHSDSMLLWPIHGQ